MILGNNNYNPDANNFKNKMNAIKENKTIMGQNPKTIQTNAHKDINNSTEMLNQSIEMLQERFNKVLISYDDFNYAYSTAKNKENLKGNYLSLNSMEYGKVSSIQYNFDYYVLENITNKLDIKPVIIIDK